MTFPVTALYAALLAIGAIVLANIVSAQRARSGVSILDGGDVRLALWMRRHGNLVEYIPLALILMALCEAEGLAAGWLHAMGAALVLGRIAHVVGLDANRPATPLRFIGGAATQLVMLASACFLIWSFL